MNDTLNIDDKQVKGLFAKLSEKEINNIMFGALKRGAKVLKDNTL